MTVSRRGFIQTIGIAAAAVAAPRPVSTQTDPVPPAPAPTWNTTDQAWIASICQHCPAGCGLLVRTVNGSVVGLRGNPLHPVNRGALCAKAFGGLQVLTDPDRHPGPLQRVGERGNGHFRRISWDEALDMLAGRLGELRGQDLAHTVVVLGGQYRGIRDTLWSRFARSYGTPNYLRLRTLTPEQPALTHRLMHGISAPLAYDLEGARFVLAFGVGLLESWAAPVWAGTVFGRWRDGTSPRATLVCVDPRRSLTAAAADRWVPIRPGMDGVLALGLAHVLLREELYDQRFVHEETQGFEDWRDETGQRHDGFKTIVLRDYGPLTVSTLTGVPIETITALARELAGTRPAVVIGERGPAFGAGDLDTRMAIHALNVLIGAIGVPGGIVMPGDLPLAPLPPVAEDDLSRQGIARPRLDGAGSGDYRFAPDVPQELPRRILADEPYPVNVVMLFATDPVTNHPLGEEFARALRKVPLVVSFSPFPDASSRLADLILPDHTFLERWQDDPVTHLAGFTAWSVGRPASPPRRDTRNTADVLLALATRLGDPVAESLRWDSYDAVLYDVARGLYEAERGYVVAPREEAWVRRIQDRQGYWTPEFDSFDDFWDALGERGAWWDPLGPPLSRRSLLATPTGKLLFFATAAGRVVAGPPSLPAAQDPDPEFPLVLSTYRPATRPLGGAENQPWLMETAPAHVPNVAWRSWVEIHPDDARRFGVAAGEFVWVESAKGRLKLIAKIHGGTVPGVVHVPWSGRGRANPNALIEDRPDALRGVGLFNATHVRLRKA